MTPEMIKILRQEAGLSQRQFSLAIGLVGSSQVISDWETGRFPPGAESLDLLKEFAIFLDYRHLLKSDGRWEQIESRIIDATARFAMTNVRRKPTVLATLFSVLTRAEIKQLHELREKEVVQPLQRLENEQRELKVIDREITIMKNKQRRAQEELPAIDRSEGYYEDGLGMLEKRRRLCVAKIAEFERTMPNGWRRQLYLAQPKAEK
jgi:transcriptional regulator with XRE-family HTH domain